MSDTIISNLSPRDIKTLKAMICTKVLSGAAIIAGMPSDSVEQLAKTIKNAVCDHEEEKVDAFSRLAVEAVRTLGSREHIRKFIFGEENA